MSDAENSPNMAGKDHSEELSSKESYTTEELYSFNDDALVKKTILINHAINEIGFTPYHWKLFCLNGMGYAVDSLLALLHSVAAQQINKEFNHSYNALVSADYVGLFCGAIFWGFTADIIGRKIAFQVTLVLAAIFCIAVAGGLSYVAVCSLSACAYFGAGGNLVLDSVTFLEFVPAKKQYLLTTMAMWWGVGQTLTCLFAWPLISNFSCTGDGPCLRKDNMGWRYVYIVSGGFILLCAFCRVFLIQMVESPKFDVSNGNDENVIATLNKIAQSGKTVNPLTLEQLQACGVVENDNSSKTLSEVLHPRESFKSFGYHIRGLFETRKLGWSTSLNFLAWAIIGIAYPLFSAFLPYYLSSRGADFGDDSLNTTYKNNLIANSVSIGGPIIAGMMCDIPRFGRRGTMCVGALLTMTFMFAYTAVRTASQNLGFSSAISVCICIHYGTLFAYTPEVMPSAHRATGYGLSVSIARIFGTIAPVIAYYGDTASSAPIYVMAALFAGLAVVSVLFPYEISGHNSM